MSVRAEADKSVKSETPTVDRSKTQNIEPGNISNEGAEKRADIGKTREPTPGGTAAVLKCSSCCIPQLERIYTNLVDTPQRHRHSMDQHQRPSTADLPCLEL